MASYSIFVVQALELQNSDVRLEQCQLVRYNECTGTLGKPFDEPKVLNVWGRGVVWVWVWVFLCA